jgi:GNAT superfamily N-acetyltransferase
MTTHTTLASPPSAAGSLNFAIRPACESDVRDLMRMIRELAQFETLEHELKTTETALHNWLFGPYPAAAALIATVDGVRAGYAVYFHTFSSFMGKPGIFLEDVYVRPQFRRRGLGSALLKAVARIGVARGCGRFEWIALHWNQTALKFYESLGSRVLEDWVLLRMNSQEMRTLAGVEVKAT